MVHHVILLPADTAGQVETCSSRCVAAELLPSEGRGRAHRVPRTIETMLTEERSQPATDDEAARSTRSCGQHSHESALFGGRCAPMNGRVMPWHGGGGELWGRIAWFYAGRF